MNFLIKLLRLDFDPDRDGLPGPNAGRPAPARQRQTETRQDLHHLDSGRATYKKNEDESWEIYGTAMRTADITDRDREEMAGADWTVKEDKYRAIKSKWAMGLSITDSSDSLTREMGRGYKTKTVEKYFVLINKAAGTSSPTTKRGEEDRKTPQKEGNILENVQY